MTFVEAREHFKEETLPKVGEVRVDSRERVESIDGHVYERQLVTVGDISDAFPEERDAFNEYLDALDALIRLQGKDWQVPTEENGYQTNPARSMFYNRFPGNSTMLEWQKDIFKAIALYPLQRPDDAERVLPGGVDQYARDVFMFALDSIGIRTRAAIAKRAELQTAKSLPDREVVVVSLGAGGGVPTIDAVRTIKDVLGKGVRMELCDIDGDSLKMARQLAEEAGIPAGDVDTYEGHFIRKLHEMKKNATRAQIFEALGLFEYLSREDAIKLLRSARELVEPGGIIVVSNMLSNRRQLKFNQLGVGWPHVVPRSEDELVSIAAAAGFDTASSLTFTIPQDGVYGVMELRVSW
jgi:SAM-dependent methyltransferase